jgi:hypothetical protein
MTLPLWQGLRVRLLPSAQVINIELIWLLLEDKYTWIGGKALKFRNQEITALYTTRLGRGLGVISPPRRRGAEVACLTSEQRIRWKAET